MKSKFLLSKVGSVSAAAAALVATQAQASTGAQSQLLVQAGKSLEESSSRRKGLAQLLLLAPTAPDAIRIDHTSHRSHSSHSSGAFVRGSGSGSSSSSVFSPSFRPRVFSSPSVRRRNSTSSFSFPSVPNDSSIEIPAPVPSVPAPSGDIISAGTVQIDPNKYLTEADLISLTGWQIKVLKNYYYARHGFSYAGAGKVTSALRRHFKAQPWYRPHTTDAMAIFRRLNAVEKHNVKLLARLDKQHRP